MSSINLWLSIAVLAATQAYLVWRRLLAYLRYFQQEGYAPVRFLQWTGARSLTDPAVWVSIASAWLSLYVPLLAVALFVGVGWLLALAQPDPRHSGKIALRLTWRATRVMAVAMVLASVLWLVFVLLWNSSSTAAFVTSAAVFAGAPLLLAVASLCLEPYEARVQREYEADAHRRVERIAPFIVGITGSYGKSSTKAILAHILQYEAPTLAATGSINTLMGLTRHIREELVFGHRFMVVEMGAFNTGSIRRLCQLTPPSAGLITAVGDMHLERFGSTDAIVKAKGELAEAVPAGGLLVVNADSPGALRIARAAAGRRVLLYGESSTESLETRLEQVEFSSNGTAFVLRTREREYACATPLLGRPIVLNIAGAFTLAAAVGVDPDVMVAALRTLRPVANRLEVVEERGITWIRDAYNSNQFGFRAALEVAAALPAVRRFLVTPGVVELGSDQFAVNRQLSREAAAVCDATIVVSSANRDAFLAGYQDAARADAQFVSVAGRAEAFSWLRETVKAGDLVILENDLPDVYEQSTGVFWGRERSLQPTPTSA